VNAAAKLGDFLDWASASGLTPVRAADYRRIAVELFETSGGSRVTESHILRLIDAYADRPGGRAAIALIEEVGEALLRYESARRMSAGISTLPAPSPMPMATPQSMPTAATPYPEPVAREKRRPSEPFTARPDERIAVELRPPAEPRETPPAQPVVSFVAGNEPAASSSSPSPKRRIVGTQFRCLRCKAMVTPDETGACPRCGQIAPRISSNQLAVVSPPSTRSASWLLPAVLGVLAFGLAYQFGPPLVEKLRRPSEPVAGVTSSPHLGLRLTFPDGWRHSAEGDRAPSTGSAGFEAVLRDGVGLRSSRFFRRGGEADAELVLSVAPRPSQVTDEVFAEWAEVAVSAPKTLEPTVRELSGVSDLVLDRCLAGPSVPGGGVRCVGNSGTTRALIYAWPARTVTAVAVFLTSQNPEAALDEGDALIGGLDLG